MWWMVFVQCFGCFVDFVFVGQEYQYVVGVFVVQFVDCVDDCVYQVVFGFVCGFYVVVVVCVFGVFYGWVIFGYWVVVYFDWIQLFVYFDYGCWVCVGVEMVCEVVGVDCCGCDDQFQVWLFWQDFFQVVEQEVDVQVVFVCFVDDQCVVCFQ